MTQQPIVNTQLLIRIGIFFLVALVAIWLIGYAKKVFGSAKGANNGSDVNPDGTPVVPGGVGVDNAYITRIATLANEVHNDKDFSGISGARCELINNLVGMRDEEVFALVNTCQSWGFSLRADVSQYESDGCINWIGTKEKIKDAQNRLKNF